MGCILVSHPHGGRKRISSGKITSISLNRLEHDCPSASGSSGGALQGGRGGDGRIGEACFTRSMRNQ